MTHYPTLAAAASAVCAECGGPAPAGPTRALIPSPSGWLALCPACVPGHYGPYKAAAKAAEAAERAARPKPPPAEPERGRVCRTLTKNELMLQGLLPYPGDTREPIK